jgi:predicted small lipoprotein YifL
MTRTAGTLILVSAILAASGCGRKGPLVLPPGRDPMPAERVSAVLEEGAIVLAWTNPVKTVSGKPLGPLGTIEIWVFEKDVPAAGATLSPEEITKRGRLLLKTPPDGGEATMSRSVPVPEGAKSLAFTVRVRDRRGRASGFSPLVVVDIARTSAGAVVPEREGP